MSKEENEIAGEEIEDIEDARYIPKRVRRASAGLGERFRQPQERRRELHPSLPLCRIRPRGRRLLQLEDPRRLRGATKHSMVPIKASCGRRFRESDRFRLITVGRRLSSMMTRPKLSSLL